MTHLDETISNLVARLVERRTAGGWWEGHLASSALATATAVGALHLAEDGDVDAGLNWLASNQNADGGWGDTVLNLSNISTSILCWCGFAIAGAGGRYPETVARVEEWLVRSAGGLEPDRLVKAILARYGTDHTFSVPILTVMAIAGKLGDRREAWRDVPQLPFELAVLPHQLFGFIGLPVVSYALPALIAIGQARHSQWPARNPLLRAARNLVIPRTLGLLRAIQPSTGGYLEATPLTSFVVMSLVTAGLRGNAVVSNGAKFLRDSMRADGSWPIDTNLATWVTTLAVDAMAALPDKEHPLQGSGKRAIREWLLAQQYQEEHPYTHAAPGGWAWTPLPGGVPDADDTPGALLALRHLGAVDGPVRESGQMGVRWLLDLQNRDGGIPTFCRGWGKLPFDRSGADLTAHAVSAWRAWLPELDMKLAADTRRGIARAEAFLKKRQRTDGSWAPLWFGNEYAAGEENLTYGTARVSMAIGGGSAWLRGAQNADGGWGGGRGAPSSIEETSLAVQALAGDKAGSREEIRRAVEWLISATDRGRQTPVTAIGLYFARLWYYEELYPLIFATGALIRARGAL